MPSHFSTLGFSVASQEEFVALAQQVSSRTQPIQTKVGQYLRWTGASGEELWLQVDHSGDLVGMHPHFAGKASLRIGVTGRVRRENDTALDGAFEGWVTPEGDVPDHGMYPLVFDAPDSATHASLKLPGIGLAQIAAFAHEITAYDSVEAFDAAQTDLKLRFAVQSFIPSGLFSPDGPKTGPPEALAIFTGYVKEAAVQKNSLTGAPFYWALVDTLGGLYDVVIDKTLLPNLPTPGGVLSGQFWLSGRITSFTQPKRSWFGKLVGGAG